MTEARLAPSFLPCTAALEMTYECNHRCKFCSCPWYRRDSKFSKAPEMTTDEWKKTIAKLCSMGVTNFSFTGGEALMRPDIFEIIEFASQCKTEHIETVDDKLVSEMKPPHLFLISNGLLIDDNVLELCKKFKVQLSVSLPGLDTFEYHTGRDGADQVLSVFSKAKALGMDAVANITVTQKNFYELYETLSAALLAGARQILMNRFLPGGRGLEYSKELGLRPEQITEMIVTADEVLEKAGSFGSLGTEIPKCSMPQGRELKKFQVGTRCSAAIQFFVLDPSGRARVCNHSEVQLEHIDEIEKMKNNDYWKRFVFRKYLPDECSGCSETYDCDGGCREAAHIVGGSLSSLDMAGCHPR